MVVIKAIKIRGKSENHSWETNRPFQLVHFFFQAEDGIRDVERSRGLGDVYKRQAF